MDFRSDSFTKKFTDALVFLGGTSIRDLVSIKYRDNVNSAQYRELINGYLKGKLGLDIKEVHGDFQGRAWLIDDHNQNRVLIVEHETGLEILYIAGSIASLISLVSLINSGWRFLRGRFLDHPFLQDRGGEVEIRIFGSKNQLLEQHVFAIEDYVISECMKEITALRLRVEILEHELKAVKESKSQNDTRKKPTASTRKAKK